jgi:hypothetical protein
MNNERFNKYYRNQNILPDEEWGQFMDALRRPLPTTFRVTGSRQYVQAIRVAGYATDGLVTGSPILSTSSSRRPTSLWLAELFSKTNRYPRRRKFLGKITRSLDHPAVFMRASTGILMALHGISTSTRLSFVNHRNSRNSIRFWSLKPKWCAYTSCLAHAN